ncbi:MAG: hypothetical protein GWO04_08480, partial [Actinobacteria bacterium]|nr:hypothetical protein [Actinomycetota bacterium]
LLRGFDIVDEPPPIKIGGRRFLPAVTTTDVQLEHFRTWAAELPADAPAFVWLHTSLPYLTQLAIPDLELPDAAAELDRLV